MSNNELAIIGTYHKEGGACISNELTRIIEDISPSVIFCEAAPEVFQKMLKATETFNTPEIKLLRKIAKDHSIEVVPVDLNNDPFDGRLEAMMELFPKRITEYFYASEIQANEIYRLGYSYLNSQDCDQIHKDKNVMEQMFVDSSNNYQLSRTYNDWLNWNDEREMYWIDSINRYHELNKFKKAVFIVGSAHRIRLMDKLLKLGQKEKSNLHWNFYPII